jgi:hypothetical protein
MRNFYSFCLFGAVAAFLTAPASADMWNIDFDNGTQTGTNGEIENIQFAPDTIFSDRYGDNWQRYDGISDGDRTSPTTAGNPEDRGVPGTNGTVTFDIDVWNGAYNTPGFAVGFDSTGTGVIPNNYNTRDYDLKEFGFDNNGNRADSANYDSNNDDGFDNNNAFNTNAFDNDNPIATTGYGNVLIIQSHEASYTKNCGGGRSSTGTCVSTTHGHVKSDDQAGGQNGAGDITFNFDEEVTLFKMNIFDIEEEGGKVKFYDADGNLIQGATVDIPVIGDNGVGLLFFNGTEGVVAKSMMIWVAGSAGFDNIMGEGTDTETEIPEPTTMALFGVGLAALGFYRRRRSLEARAAHQL